jgi:hypothetical protein
VGGDRWEVFFILFECSVVSDLTRNANAYCPILYIEFIGWIWMPGPIYEREGERAIAIVAPDTDRAPTLGSGWAVPYV